MNSQSSLMGNPYEIVSIQRAETPPDGEGADWYDYEIVQGQHTINGCRQGKLKAVTEAVEVIVAQLNERRYGKRGRAPSAAKTKK
ncbi:MAG: hypothetical protein O3A13_04560 [Proteobacteria bacterium]|nr:hypothetical protein [Pseudomonadota bacterium]MDA0992884.1 hypothetical protein [Pseudomonadota bacterium]